MTRSRRELLTPASRSPIHVPFAGRSNPISERPVELASALSLPEQSVSHQVTIFLCDGIWTALSPKPIQHPCRFAGQLGWQGTRPPAPPAFLRGDASPHGFVFGSLLLGVAGGPDGGAQVRVTNDQFAM